MVQSIPLMQRSCARGRGSQFRCRPARSKVRASRASDVNTACCSMRSDSARCSTTDLRRPLLHGLAYGDLGVDEAEPVERRIAAADPVLQEAGEDAAVTRRAAKAHAA